MSETVHAPDHQEQTDDGEHLIVIEEKCLVSTGESLRCGGCYMPASRAPHTPTHCAGCKVEWKYLAIDSGSQVNQYDYNLLVVEKGSMRPVGQLSRDEMQSLYTLVSVRLRPEARRITRRAIENACNDLSVYTAPDETMPPPITSSPR